MNFRELINKLDHINEAESSLTLQSIAAIEKDAMDKATSEKTKGGWTGFTTWNPRTAGNIALAKLAQQNNFEGLFNSEGDFVVAYGNRTWSSNSEMHPGENPRVVPPSPDDWKPLAAKGLVPQNAKGPAGLLNWLSSGGAQKEFDAVKKQSADVATGTSTINAAQAPKISATDEGATMTQLEGLVDQYLKLKADIKTGVKKDQAAKVTTDPMDDSNDANAHAFDPTWGGTKATGGQSVAPNAGATWDNTKQMAVPGVVKESALASALVESFGYQKKMDLNQLIESFGYRKNHPYATKFLSTVLSEVDNAKDNLKSLDSEDDVDADAYLQKKFGNRDDVKGLGGDKRTWDEKNIIAKFVKADWKSITWEDEIIPGGIYTMRDLGLDLGIAAGFVLVGTIAAPFFGTAAGTAAGAGYVAGGIIVRLLVRIAIAIIRYAKALGNPFWQLLKANPAKFAQGIGDIAKTYRNAFYEGLKGNLARVPLAVTALITMTFNGIGNIIKHHWPEQYEKLEKAKAWVGDKVLEPAADAVDNVTGYRTKLGLKENLA